MKLTILNRITLVITLCFSIKSAAFSQANAQDITEKQVKKWIGKHDWASGLNLNADKSTNAAEFYKQYHAVPVLWQKVFSWLKKTDLDTLTKGRYIIDGDKAYAIITEAPSKELDQTSWESHRNYIDLQYVIRGKEKIGLSPINKAILTNTYDEKRDVANYTAAGQYYIAMPGTFYLFFPADAHRPNIKVDGFDLVKKLVIKIHVAQ